MSAFINEGKMCPKFHLKVKIKKKKNLIKKEKVLPTNSYFKYLKVDHNIRILIPFKKINKEIPE